MPPAVRHASLLQGGQPALLVIGCKVLWVQSLWTGDPGELPWVRAEALGLFSDGLDLIKDFVSLAECCSAVYAEKKKVEVSHAQDVTPANKQCKFDWLLDWKKTNRLDSGLSANEQSVSNNQTENCAEKISRCGRVVRKPREDVFRCSRSVTRAFAFTCHCSEHSNGQKGFQVRRETLGEALDGRSRLRNACNSWERAVRGPVRPEPRRTSAGATRPSRPDPRGRDRGPAPWTEIADQRKSAAK
ncbi:hypothetical protein NDU88_003664 [Pleurodeles waltl]|uniref:Uncharacterized protein n=1 Tax=Pleurodeles waltl TaxID=8319 RepID=A0AAV7LHP5_PLEWA|nr:hypothetical protein NDU88_003664 [Pleurodeles waltl]